VFEQIWNYKIQLAPIFLAFVIFEIPTLIRKWKKMYYVPIYFALFPLDELNKEIAIYFGEEYETHKGADYTSEQAEKVRKKIIQISMISLFLAAVVTPLIAGFISSLFLSRDLLAPFLVFLVAVKAKRIVDSLIGLRGESIGTKKNTALIATTYVTYLGTAVEMFRTAYNYGQPFAAAHNWGGLASDLSTLIFGKVIVGGIIMAVMGSVVTSLILDRKLREQIIKENSKSSSPAS
jgi:hypothetical protein